MKSVTQSASPIRRVRLVGAVIAVLIASHAVHAQVQFLGGFTENFDGMGVSGTTPPPNWSMKTGNAGTDNNTWSTTIPGSGVASMVAAATPLTAIATPAANNNNGFNASKVAVGGLSTDRALATSPTGISGGAIELSLENKTGNSLSLLNISYDIVRFTSVSTVNQLPGYWFFYSLDSGANWTNVSILNSTIATVPNTVGVTNVSLTPFTLAWANNATLLLRWVDDNAQQTSPDQIIGLDNLVLIPEPAHTSLALGAAMLLGLKLLRRRRA